MDSPLRSNSIISASPHWSFIGRLSPERYDWSLAEPISVQLGGDHPLDVSLTITHSQICIRLQGHFPGTLLDLKNTASDIAQALVDAVGFVFAAAIDVEIATCIDANGNFHVFNTAFDGIREGDLDSDALTALASKALGHWAFRAALSDHRQAIAEVNGTAALCYRAVESIRQSYVIDDGNRASSWEALRASTGVTEDELRWLENKGTPRRHGEVIDLSEEDRRKALRIARRVILRHIRAAS